MKGFASINPIFEPFASISNPHVFSINPMIVADNRSHTIYFISDKTFLKIEPKIIINTCYSSKHGAIMLLTQDGRLRVYTQNFDEIARLPWQSKYSVGLEFMGNDSMLMIGATEVQLLYVKVYSNIRSTKFVSSMSFNIEKKQKYVVEPETKLQWNKGFNFSEKHKILYLWSSKDINFYSLNKLNLIAHIPSLTRKQLSITQVLYNINHKYTITGLINGVIKVWRLPINIKEYTNFSNPHSYSSKDYILIHNYLKHSKPIDKIIQANFSNSSKQVNTILISSSLDLTVCFWSLETFELLRFYDFQGEYSALYLYNSVYSLGVKDRSLGTLQWGRNLQFITDVTSQIIAFDKHQSEFSFKKDQPIKSIQLTLGSNIGFQIRDEHLDARDLNKIEIQYIYPPLKAKGIQQIISSPYDENQYYLLVENGEIFRLRIEENSGKIEQSYQIQRAKDIEFHQLNQLPSVISFLPILPPQFDSQINENNIEKKSNAEVDIHKNEELRKQKLLKIKLIAVGCSKGSVVFFSLDNFQNIYTRITYHREPIKHLQSFSSSEHDYVVSYCLENFIKVVKFDSALEKAHCIISIYAGSYISKLIGFQDKLAIVFIKGFFQIYQISQISELHRSTVKKGLANSQFQLRCIKNSQGNDHESSINSIDYDHHKKLIITAGADNKLKIWTSSKILIYEVFLDEGLRCAIWFRNFEILVSHNLKILYFRNIGLKITEEEIERINEQFMEGDFGSQTISDTLKMIKDLHEQDGGEKQMIEISESRVKRDQSLIEKPSPKQKSVISSPTQTKGRLNKSVVHKNEIKLDFNQNIRGEFSRDKQIKTKQSFIKHSSESTRKKRETKKQPKSMTMIEEQESKHIPDSDLDAMRKHLDQMKNLKKQANQSILPKIGPKNQDIFDNFMRSKLLNKKILTRRDITLNRIIMKNIIKDHFGNDSDVVNNLKLDF